MKRSHRRTAGPESTESRSELEDSRREVWEVRE